MGLQIIIIRCFIIGLGIYSLLVVCSVTQVIIQLNKTYLVRIEQVILPGSYVYYYLLVFKIGVVIKNNSFKKGILLSFTIYSNK